MATIAITPEGPFSLAASGRFLEGFAPARYHGPAPDGAIPWPSPPTPATPLSAPRSARPPTAPCSPTSPATPTPPPRKPSWPASSHSTSTAADLRRSLKPTRSWPGSQPDTRGCGRCASAPPTRPPPGRSSGTASGSPRPPRSRNAPPSGTASTSPSPERRLPPSPPPAHSATWPAYPGCPRSRPNGCAPCRASACSPPSSSSSAAPGIPTCFPARERRLHAAMADEYHLDHPSPGQLAELSARWAPYRS